MRGGKESIYAKVFTQILDSSLAENWEIRHVFEDMLKLCDSDGVVDMTHEAIARRTNTPLEIVRNAISVLEAPDTKSRTADANGVRIARLDEHRDWGWHIVNYKKFREIASEEQRKASTRERVARWREKHVTPRNARNARVTQRNASNAREKEREKDKDQGQERERGAGKSEFAEWPSEKEVVDYGQIIGLAEWKCRDFFHEMEGCGWLDFQHRPIKKWQPILCRVRKKWEADGRPSGPPKSHNAEPQQNQI